MTERVKCQMWFTISLSLTLSCPFQEIWAGRPVSRVMQMRRAKLKESLAGVSQLGPDQVHSHLHMHAPVDVPDHISDIIINGQGGEAGASRGARDRKASRKETNSKRHAG